MKEDRPDLKDPQQLRAFIIKCMNIEPEEIVRRDNSRAYKTLYSGLSTYVLHKLTSDTARELSLSEETIEDYCAKYDKRLAEKDEIFLSALEAAKIAVNPPKKRIIIPFPTPHIENIKPHFTLGFRISTLDEILCYRMKKEAVAYMRKVLGAEDD